MSETVTVIKQGELCVQVLISRTSLGLQLTARAHPSIEAMFRTDAKFPIERAGKSWLHIGDKPLEFYSGSLSDTLTVDGPDGFRLDLLGRNFDPVNDAMTNLSFLRLVGISNPEGVTFGVKGVFSLAATKELRDRIGASTKRFYAEFLKPVDFEATLVMNQTYPGGW